MSRYQKRGVLIRAQYPSATDDIGTFSIVDSCCRCLWSRRPSQQSKARLLASFWPQPFQIAWPRITCFATTHLTIRSSLPYLDCMPIIGLSDQLKITSGAHQLDGDLLRDAIES